jgi:small-conductance mechanosensitive channel
MHRCSPLLWSVAIAVFAVSPGAAQDSTMTPVGAPVVVAGDTLFTLVGALGPFSAADRAAALARRIDSLAVDPSAAGRPLRVVDTAGATDILSDTAVIMTVTDRDAVASELGRTELATQFAAQIERAVATRPRATTLKGFLTGALYTVLTTLALGLLLVGLSRAFHWTTAHLESWRGTLIPAIRIQRLEVLSANRVADVLLMTVRVLRIAAVIFVLYMYLPLVLGFFPRTEGLSGTIVGWVVDPLRQAGSSFVAYIPDIFTIAVIVAVVFYLVRFIHLIFIGLERGAIAIPGFYTDWAEPTFKIVRFVIIAFAVILIWPYLPGSDSKAFQGISVFLGILISFGSASAIANIIAGVVMTYMRPFQLGDRVKIAETVGDVVEKNLLVTRIRTTKNVDTTVPNAMVLASHIVNYSSSALQRGVILHTTVTIGYDVPWRTVHTLLISSATTTEGILEEPKPFVLQTSLDDFYVSYELNAYTDQPNAMSQIYSTLHQHIQDRFARAGVEIMSPHYRADRDGSAIALPPQEPAEDDTAGP